MAGFGLVCSSDLSHMFSQLIFSAGAFWVQSRIAFLNSLKMLVKKMSAVFKDHKLRIGMQRNAFYQLPDTVDRTQIRLYRLEQKG